jgi:hypothetical protein
MDQRRINKAIYLILEKYHRIYGLKLVGFSGGHGYGYGMFYIDAIKPMEHNSLDTDYECIKVDRTFSLVIYLTSVGIPEWSGRSSTKFNLTDATRTQEIVDWLLENLTIDHLLKSTTVELQRWRSNYSVERAEKYLLMMNLVGIYQAKKGLPYTTLEANFSDYDFSWPEKVATIRTKLFAEDQNSVVWGANNIYFSENGLALINRVDIVDYWEMHLSGMTADEILDVLEQKLKTQTALIEALPLAGDDMTSILRFIDRFINEINGYEYGDSKGGYSNFLCEAEHKYKTSGIVPSDVYENLALIYLVYRRNRNAEFCSIEEHREFIDALLSAAQSGKDKY